jgi:hypothetical protein
VSFGHAVIVRISKGLGTEAQPLDFPQPTRETRVAFETKDGTTIPGTDAPDVQTLGPERPDGSENVQGSGLAPDGEDDGSADIGAPLASLRHEFRFQSGRPSGESWVQGSFDEAIHAENIIEATQEVDDRIALGMGQWKDADHVRVLGPDGEMRHRPLAGDETKAWS